MTYAVTVTRERGDWLATVTDLDGVSTWAPIFVGLDRNVREAIALAADLPAGAEAALDITWQAPQASWKRIHIFPHRHRSS